MNTPEKKRYTIGIMLGDIQSDYSEDLISGFYTCAREEDVNLIFLMGPQAPLYCTDILLSNDNGHYHYQFDTIYDYAHFSKLDAMIIAYGSLSLSTRSSNLEQFLNNYADIPCLLLEDIPKSTDAPYLIADNYNGTRSCMSICSISIIIRKNRIRLRPQKQPGFQRAPCRLPRHHGRTRAFGHERHGRLR